jgi:guanylate kinase
MGFLYIVAAPSGGGKTSLVGGLLDSVDGIEVSVSYTTRAPRPGEVDAKDYHFVTDDVFNTMVENKDFLEHAGVFGHQYGTSRHLVAEVLQQGIDIILEIDWQGARQIRQMFADARSIYILPPSIEILEQRLIGRQQDEAKVVNFRMELAQSEMSHAHEFDYMIINDDYDNALLDLRSIILANRLKMGRQLNIHKKLLAELAQNS